MVALNVLKEILLLLLLFLVPASTKPQAEILELNKVNGCNDISFSDHSILEGDRIPPLKRNSVSLESSMIDDRDHSILLLLLLFINIKCMATK